MAYALVSGQTNSGRTESGNLDIAFPANVTANNLLICAGGCEAGQTVTVTDSAGGNAFTVVMGTASPSNSRPFIAYRLAPSSAAFTVRVGGAFYHSAAIAEFSGAHSTPADVNGGTTTGESAAASDDIDPSVADALLIGVMVGDWGEPWTAAPGANYTQFGEEEDADNWQNYNAVYRIVTTDQNYTVAWTNTNKGWAAQTHSFKPAVGGPTIVAADGSSSGLGTSSVVGRAIFNSSAAGTGSTAGIVAGAALWNASSTSAGAAGGSTSGAALWNTALSSAGIGASSVVGASLANAAAAAAGITTTNALISAFAGAVGSSIGLGAAFGISPQPPTEVDANATGIGTVSGVGARFILGVGGSTGLSALSGISNIVLGAIGASSGLVNISADGQSVVPPKGKLATFGLLRASQTHESIVKTERFVRMQ